MKILYILTLLLCTLGIKAQEYSPGPIDSSQIVPLSQVAHHYINGTWKGSLFQDNSLKSLRNYSFEMNLEIDENNKVKGSSLIKVDKYYARIRLSGELKGDSLLLQEDKILDSSFKERYYWCLKKMQLQLNFKRHKFRLTGPWSGYSSPDSPCSPGDIQLKKSTIRA